MVREKKIFPPVYLTALGAALVIYTLSLPALNSSLTPTICMLAFFLFASALTLRLLLPVSPFKRKLLFLSLCALAGICIGALSGFRIQYEKRTIISLAEPDRIISLTGKLTGDPQPYGDSFYRVPIKLQSCAYRDQSIFSAKGICTALIPANMIKESQPGSLSTYQQHSPPIIFSSGLNIKLNGSMTEYNPTDGEIFMVSEVDDAKANWTSPLLAFRADIRLSLMRLMYDWKEAGGFLLALLSANRDYLESGLSESFKTTGLSHILALSGMHLSLIGVIVINMGKKIGGKRFSIRLSLFAILFFVWFAGASPSLDRALIMALMLIFIRYLGFDPDILSILAATFCVQILLKPADALSLGFMLSYAALWGILWFGSRLSYLWQTCIPSIIRSELSASIGAQVLTTPVIALTIGTLAPIGVVASCIVGPVSSVFLVAGMLLTGIALILPPLSFICGSFLDFLYRCVTIPVGLFARIPPLSLRGFNDIMATFILCFITGLVLIYITGRSQKRRSPDDSFARL